MDEDFSLTSVFQIASDIVEDFFRSEDRTTVQADDVIRFFVIGDFGTLAKYPGLRNSAVTMEKLAASNNYSHIITVGDNFYINGIPNINLRLHPWLVTSVFRREIIGQLKIYPTLGNHDCYVNYKNEIEYSNYNEQWTMESDYYELVTPLRDDPSKNFVNLMLNSCKLMCPDHDWASLGRCTSMQTELGSDEVVEHYRWLEEKLQFYSNSNSTAWLAVTLHHPVFTESGLKVEFLPLVRKYNVDFIFVGHQHWAEYANMDPDYEVRFPPESPKILKD